MASGFGFGDMTSMLSKATQALDDAKKAAEEKASALGEGLSTMQAAAEEKASALQATTAFTQLESMMAATPGQLVADARERVDASAHPLGSLDVLETPAKRPAAGMAPAAEAADASAPTSASMASMFSKASRALDDAKKVASVITHELLLLASEAVQAEDDPKRWQLRRLI